MGAIGRPRCWVDPSHPPCSPARRTVAGLALVGATIATGGAGAVRPTIAGASTRGVVHVGGVPDRVVVGAGAVWVGDGGRGSRVHPATHRIDPVHRAATPLPVGSGRLWARAPAHPH